MPSRLPPRLPTAVMSILACLFVLVSSMGSLAAEDLPKFKKGDKLEVEFLGSWIEAEFVEYFPTGWLTVKHANNVPSAPPIQRTLPPDQCRVSKKAKKKPAPATESSSTPKEAEERTWTDITGKHKVVAKFTGVEDGKVVLLKADGKEVKIPLAKLMDADRKLAEKLASGSSDENPFEEASDPEEESAVEKAIANSKEGRRQKAKAAGGDDDPEGITLKSPDWSEGGAITIIEGEPNILTEDPAPTYSGAVAKKGIVLEGGKGTDHFDNAKGIYFNAKTGRGIVAHVSGRPGESMETTLEVVDTASGKSVALMELVGNGVPQGISPSGKYIVCRSGALHSGTKSRVDVWDVEGTQAKHVLSFKPHGTKENHKRDIKITGFVDDKHIFTVDHEGQLTVWEVSRARALYSYMTAGSLSDSAAVAVSPGGKYLAALTKSGLCVLEPLTGNILARYECPVQNNSRASFSTDGKLLALTNGHQLMVWDITTGVMDYDIFIASSTNPFLADWSPASIEWPADGYVLLGGRALVDLKKKMLLWDYGHPADAFASFGGKHWYVLRSDDRSTRTLLQVTIPHAGAIAAAEKLDPENTLVIKPGTEIALNVTAAMSEENRQKVFTHLTERLTEMGMKVVPTAKVTIDAFSQPGQSRQVNYRTIGGFGGPFGGGGPGGGTFNVTPQTMTFGIREGDVVLWKASMTTDVPPILHTDQNKTMQQAADEYVMPRPEFYLMQPIPRYLARPGKFNGAFGGSHLTKSGIEPVAPGP